jgi:hypothetical protein
MKGDKEIPELLYEVGQLSQENKEIILKIAKACVDKQREEESENLPKEAGEKA